MTIEQFFTDWWGAILVSVILLVIILFVVGRNMRKKGKVKDNSMCNHKFEYRGCLVINKNGEDFPRQVLHCSLCKEAIHLPIKTLSQLTK